MERCPSPTTFNRFLKASRSVKSFQKPPGSPSSWLWWKVDVSILSRQQMTILKTRGFHWCHWTDFIFLWTLSKMHYHDDPSFFPMKEWMKCVISCEVSSSTMFFKDSSQESSPINRRPRSQRPQSSISSPCRFGQGGVRGPTPFELTYVSRSGEWWVDGMGSFWNDFTERDAFCNLLNIVGDGAALHFCLVIFTASLPQIWGTTRKTWSMMCGREKEVDKRTVSCRPCWRRTNTSSLVAVRSGLPPSENLCVFVGDDYIVYLQAHFLRSKTHWNSSETSRSSRNWKGQERSFMITWWYFQSQWKNVNRSFQYDRSQSVWKRSHHWLAIENQICKSKFQDERGQINYPRNKKVQRWFLKDPATIYTKKKKKHVFWYVGKRTQEEKKNSAITRQHGTASCNAFQFSNISHHKLQ